MKYILIQIFLDASDYPALLSIRHFIGLIPYMVALLE